MTTEYCYSCDKNDWVHACDTAEEAVEDFLGRNDAYLDTITVYRGRKQLKKFEHFFNVDSIIEDMQGQAYDDSPEFADDYLDDVTDEQKEELESMVLQWAKKHEFSPTWYDVIDIEEQSFDTSSLKKMMPKELQDEVDTILGCYEMFKADMEASHGMRNRYLNSENVSIYARKQLSISDNGEPSYHLCIGSVDVSEGMQKKGVFTAILKGIEERIGHFGSVEVQCVLNPDLEKFLVRQGYDYLTKSEFEVSLIKSIKG